ncbi:alanine racemase [Gammaproteobacteria bacterium 42_54_T18]|nr:alanine racemase [Gammaproteobacteria bacterium 42_54_T18]
MSTAVAFIDMSALQHNYSYISKLAPDSKVFSVIKANAYGHGLTDIAMALVGHTDGFAVARVEEATAIRTVVFGKPILILGGYSSKEELEVILKGGFFFTIHNWIQIEWLRSFLTEQSETNIVCGRQIWIKVDTGMHRLGFRDSDIPHVVRALRVMGIEDKINLITHYSCADFPANVHNTKQFSKWEFTVKDCAEDVGYSTISNSALIFTQHQYHADWIRPGISLYGSTSFIDDKSEQLVHSVECLRPVMHFTSKVSSVRYVLEEQPIGYGDENILDQPGWIASIAVGYGDGYPRSARNGTPVLINGQRAKLLGRVSMDTITVQLTDGFHASVGDTVTLWGPGLSVDEVAIHCNTISYDLLCGISERVRRVVVSG